MNPDNQSTPNRQPHLPILPPVKPKRPSRRAKSDQVNLKRNKGGTRAEPSKMGRKSKSELRAALRAQRTHARYLENWANRTVELMRLEATRDVEKEQAKVSKLEADLAQGQEQYEHLYELKGKLQEHINKLKRKIRRLKRERKNDQEELQWLRELYRPTPPEEEAEEPTTVEESPEDAALRRAAEEENEKQEKLCSICYDEEAELFRPCHCAVQMCRGCLQSLLPNRMGQILCPMCRRQIPQHLVDHPEQIAVLSCRKCHQMPAEGGLRTICPCGCQYCTECLDAEVYAHQDAVGVQCGECDRLRPIDDVVRAANQARRDAGKQRPIPLTKEQKRRRRTMDLQDRDEHDRIVRRARYFRL